MKPNTKDMYIFCPECHLGDFYITFNEATGQSAVVCQNCGAPFIQIQYVPAEAPDPSIVI